MDRLMQLARQCAALIIRGFGAMRLAILFLLPAIPALAQDKAVGVVVEPRPWQMSLQPGYSPTARDVIWLNNYIVTPIIVIIVVLVGVLLAWVLWRYNHTRNPVPTTTTHNKPLEIVWTVIPVLVLIGMAIPSFRIVFYQNRTNDPYMTVKITGHQWYWEYDYPDHGNLDFMSNFIPENQLKPGQPRLLTVNHPLVLPVGENIRILQTSGDVIHSFFVPSLGMQRYAIPGQTIETWVRIDKPGLFYGECNQICGLGHHEMPIEVEGVPLQQFLAWVKIAQQQNAANGTIPPVSAVAAVTPQGASALAVAEIKPRSGPAPGKGD